MNFTSDNCSGVHPAVMAAIQAANDSRVPSYGADALTRAAEDRIRETFEAPDAAVMFVTTGTAANAIALGLVAPPWGRIFCHKDAHIETSECGAPEMFTAGAKLTLLAGEGGMIDADEVDRAVSYWAGEGLGGSEGAAISITNATEWGRVWAPDDIAALSAIARQHGLSLHMDGSRLANAIAAGAASPADLTHRAGVDVVCLGGTKNGAMGVEAVVAFDPEAAARLNYLRKRGGHLLSKHRYLAAQFYALLEQGLWLDLARHANDMAALLAEKLVARSGATLIQPAQTNQVFASLPRDAIDAARSAGAMFHDWNLLDPSAPSEAEDLATIRLVCDWMTAADEVERVVAALAGEL